MVPYQQWYQVFEWFEYLIDLPHLNSIKLGYCALYGRNDESCSLKMENLPKLTSITSNGDSFEYPRSIILSNIPNLQTVYLPYSFRNVRSKSITSIWMNINEWIDVSPILANLVKIKNW